MGEPETTSPAASAAADAAPRVLTDALVRDADQIEAFMAGPG
mgnify:CR=1 FL=1